MPMPFANSGSAIPGIGRGRLDVAKGEAKSRARFKPALQAVEAAK